MKQQNINSDRKAGIYPQRLVPSPAGFVPGVFIMVGFGFFLSAVGEESGFDVDPTFQPNAQVHQRLDALDFTCPAAGLSLTVS